MLEGVGGGNENIMAGKEKQLQEAEVTQKQSCCSSVASTGAGLLLSACHMRHATCDMPHALLLLVLLGESCKQQLAAGVKLANVNTNKSR